MVMAEWGYMFHRAWHCYCICSVTEHMFIFICRVMEHMFIFICSVIGHMFIFICSVTRRVCIFNCSVIGHVYIHLHQHVLSKTSVSNRCEITFALPSVISDLSQTYGSEVGPSKPIVFRWGKAAYDGLLNDFRF